MREITGMRQVRVRALGRSYRSIVSSMHHPRTAAAQAAQAGCVYEDTLFTARVLSIIASHDPTTPLFLSWTPHVAHVPLEVPQAYLDRFAHINVSSRRSYMAMVNYIDDQVYLLVL